MRIGIVGAQGTGKTTLLEALRPKLPDYKFIPEVARTIMKRMGLIDLHSLKNLGPGYGLKFQLSCLIEQLSSEDSAGENFVSDRSVLDSWVYCKYRFFEGISFNFWELYETCVLRQTKLYDLIVYTPLEFPPVSDGVRSSNQSYQRQIDTLIQGAISRFNPRNVVEVTGAVDARVQQVISKILEISVGTACE
jgi:nicotinamide riboside kinase